MKYKKVVEGQFIERPNRFIAKVKIGDEIETVHVKNTGRCKELLSPGVTVFLEDCKSDKRKTRYDLIAVKKGERLINMDSQAPNGAVYEWLQNQSLIPNITKIKPETTYGQSRFDFYIETKDKKIFMEVKGVTLEENNVVSFPDAPSERAIKHMKELMSAVKEGYETYICFVVQMADVLYFKPNSNTQPKFTEVLQAAKKAGVKVVAFDCYVESDEMIVRNPVPVKLFVDSHLHQTVEPLLAWYDQGHRQLPWREDPTPYHVWISEIMLQQTRVEAVKPYYYRFMEALPTIESLANVEENRLLKLWEGLGYYNRARNLQKAAKQIVEWHQGIMPSTYEELLKLSGIGSYTAGAISSIAYQEAAPAVDGNVLRILSRLRLDGEDILSAKVKKRVEQELHDVIPVERPGDYNQALMELGATICIPNGEPRCEVCPWQLICMAYKENRIKEFPVKATKKARTIEKKTVLVIYDQYHTVIKKRESTGLLAGLYEFPIMEGHQNKKAVMSYLEKLGLSDIKLEKLQPAKHIFTHKEWHMVGYGIPVTDVMKELLPLEKENYILVNKEETEEKYPIPSAYVTYSKYLGIHLANEKYETKPQITRIE